MQSQSGIVFDIKKFSIHDGPGIRTTVFLKGCPLHCSWCHNPEGQSSNKEILFWENRCINYHECIQVCKTGALAVLDGHREYSYSECQLCGECADACPSEATELVGKEMIVLDIIEEIEKDIIYYDQSGGGATFSGGEPFYQIHFLEALLIECKDRGIHTAVDTSGFTPYENIKQVQSFVDLFLFDVKIMDSDKHLQYTGVTNQTILDNLVKLTDNGNKVIPRIPIIPGVNDDMANIRQTGEFLIALRGVREINILPYHHTAAHKYSRLNNDYILSDIQPPSEDDMAKIAWEFENFGFFVRVGG